MIIVHPDYDQHTIDNDFTLVKLSSPVTLNDHVALACFPSETDNLTNTFPEGWSLNLKMWIFFFILGKDCMVTGWGSINPEGDVWGPVLKQDYAELWTNQNWSEHIWSIKDQELDYIINWKIIEKTSGFNPITLQCKICLSEIYHIIINPNQASLNKRHETYSYCRHLKKYTLDKAQFYYIKGGALILKSGRWVILSINFNFF